jgi:tetratricopeptide (TPR) repeat protein
MFQGQLEASRANYLAAAEQFQLSYRGFLGTAGEKSASTWGALGEQGRMLLLAQRFDQAEEVIRRVYEARRAIFPPGSMDVALSEWQLGNVLRARGKAEQALVFHERALTSLSKALPAEHPQISGITSEIVRDLMVLPEQASKLRARTMVEAWVKQKPASLESSEQHAVWVELAAQTGAEDARQALALELDRASSGQ